MPLEVRPLAKLKIPEKHLDGMAAIRVLTDTQKQSFVAELDSSLGQRKGQDFPAGHVVAGLDGSTVANIYDTLKELYTVRERDHMSVGDFADGVIAAMNSATGRSDLGVSDAELPAFRSRFVKLLAARAFGVEAKVADLTRDVEHSYCSSRVLTDLRPVFGDTVADGPIRMVVMHTLRIAFHNYGEHNELYVSLSDSAISALLAELQRAQEKARLLTARFVNSGSEAKR